MVEKIKKTVKKYSSLKVKIETYNKIVDIAKREKRSILVILELAVILYDGGNKKDMK